MHQCICALNYQGLLVGCGGTVKPALSVGKLCLQVLENFMQF